MRFKRYLLLSASSLVLVAASGTSMLAQTPNASPSPSPTPPAAAAPPQATGGNVLPETRVVAPAERRRPRTAPRQVVTRRAPAQTQVSTQTPSQATTQAQA